MKTVLSNHFFFPFSRRNCDKIYDQGFKKDGVYGLLLTKDYVQVYCEFESGNNWMVNIILIHY